MFLYNVYIYIQQQEGERDRERERERGKTRNKMTALGISALALGFLGFDHDFLQRPTFDMSCGPNCIIRGLYRGYIWL